MTVWALADLHLAISIPNKTMEVFGPSWHDYQNRIEKNWHQVVKEEDLVLIPGDICWAMHIEDAQKDLQWIDALPGTKVMIKGNHDYWWTSIGKVQKILPPSIHAIQNNAFHWKDFSIAGSRLWDTNEYRFDSIVHMTENPKANINHIEETPEEREKIFARELQRLETSLKQLSSRAKVRLAMTHYPPINVNLDDSRVSKLLEKYGVNLCVFGHIHNATKDRPLFGIKNGINYQIVAADYLEFHPLKIWDET